MHSKTFLENKIKRHSYEYYTLSSPTISDSEFDLLYDELKANYPDSELLSSVGSDLKEGFPKGRHLIKMGSQEKIKTSVQLHDWIKRKNIQFPVVIEYKLDGISIELQYQDGVLVSALTRGDSEVGDEIYSNVIKMRGVPNRLHNKAFTGAVRGEVLMDYDTFNRKYKDQGFANPRNLASGIAKSKFGENCSDLTVLCYDIQSLTDEYFFETEIDKLCFLSKETFEVAPFYLLAEKDDILEVSDSIHRERKNNEIRFAIDGIVIKQNRVDESDLKKIRPDTQRAFKWEDEGVETVLREIEWSRSGTTYTPIAIFDQVEIEGTQVSRASLANESLIRDLDLAIGDSILVTKRNMIIPKIEEVLHRPSDRVEIEVPIFCYCCGESLVREEKKIYCKNMNCPGKAEHRLAKWLYLLDVKGFGLALQEHLFANGIHDIADLYNQTLVQEAYENTNLKANFKKAFDELYSIKKISLAKFFAGFDIEGLGEKIFENLIEAGYDDIYKILSLKEVPVESFSAIQNFGTERARILKDGLQELYETILYTYDFLYSMNIFLEEKKEEKVLGSLSGKRICVTGKLENFSRKEIDEFIQKNGGISDSGVNKNTDILVTNDQTSGSSKLKAAEKFGTKIINEKELMELCSSIN